MKKISSIKHVLWDWNGTLLNDTRLVWDIGNVQLRQHGLKQLGFEEFQVTFTHPVRDFYVKMGYDLSRLSFSDLAEAFHTFYTSRTHEIALHHDVLPCLKRLKQQGFTQSVLSAYPHDRLLSVLKKFEVLEHLTEALGLGDSLGHGKVEVGKSWLTRSQLNPNEVVVIGDTTHDFEVAQALNVECILVARGFQSAATLQACGVPVVRDLEQACELFCSLS